MVPDDPIDQLITRVRRRLRTSDLIEPDFEARDEDVGRLLAVVEHLRAENDAAWDALADLGDYLTPEQIGAELARKGIDTSRAIERVKAALRVRKGG